MEKPEYFYKYTRLTLSGIPPFPEICFQRRYRGVNEKGLLSVHSLYIYYLSIPLNTISFSRNQGNKMCSTYTESSVKIQKIISYKFSLISYLSVWALLTRISKKIIKKNMDVAIIMSHLAIENNRFLEVSVFDWVSNIQKLQQIHFLFWKVLKKYRKGKLAFPNCEKSRFHYVILIMKNNDLIYHIHVMIHDKI